MKSQFTLTQGRKDMYWSRQLRYPGTEPASESANFGSKADAGTCFFPSPGPALLRAALLSFFHFFLGGELHMGILVPQPGVKPMPVALEVQSLRPWTTREVPVKLHFQ